MTRNALQKIRLPICEVAQETLKATKEKESKPLKVQMMNTFYGRELLSTRVTKH
jgi:hypothetical protein